MSKRATLRQHTRDRILEAAAKLHSERGIFGTSWQDIAREADVSLATVYNHFPSLNELVPACGELLMERFRPPTPSSGAEIIGGARGRRDRLKRVAQALFAFYERAGALMEIDIRERRLASVRDWEAYQLQTVEALVSEALSEEPAGRGVVQLLAALFDFPTFKAFRTRGLSPEVAAIAVSETADFLFDRRTEGKKQDGGQN